MTGCPYPHRGLLIQPSPTHPRRKRSPSPLRPPPSSVGGTAAERESSGRSCAQRKPPSRSGIRNPPTACIRRRLSRSFRSHLRNRDDSRSRRREGKFFDRCGSRVLVWVTECRRSRISTVSSHSRRLIMMKKLLLALILGMIMSGPAAPILKSFLGIGSTTAYAQDDDQGQNERRSGRR
jgi:hypothetical protein